MKSKNRLLTTIKGGIPDRIPVVYFGLGASEVILNRSNVTWKDLQENWRSIEKVMLTAYQLWGFDNVNVFLNAEFGLDTLTGDRKFRYPFHRRLYQDPLIKSEYNVEQLLFPKFQGNNTMAQVVKAAESLHNKIGNEVALIGGFGGITNWALALRGVRNFLRDTKQNNSLLKKLLGFLTEVAIEYSKAQIDAGCDCIITMEDLFEIEMLGPTAGHILGPYLRKLADSIHQEGAYYILHCCGDCILSSKEMIETGADVLSVDRVNLSSFKKKVMKKVAVLGNVKTSILLYGTPKEVKETCKETIRIGGKDGGFLLSSGYICPPKTPEKNMRVLAASTKVSKHE